MYGNLKLFILNPAPFSGDEFTQEQFLEHEAIKNLRLKDKILTDLKNSLIKKNKVYSPYNHIDKNDVGRKIFQSYSIKYKSKYGDERQLNFYAYINYSKEEIINYFFKFICEHANMIDTTWYNYLKQNLNSKFKNYNGDVKSYFLTTYNKKDWACAQIVYQALNPNSSIKISQEDLEKHYNPPILNEKIKQNLGVVKEAMSTHGEILLATQGINLN